MSKDNDLDVRPILFFRNYDYVGPDESTNDSPGRGLYNGRMDRYKSVKDFLNFKRKKRPKVKNANITPEKLLQATSKFVHLVAQNVSIDYSAIDSVKGKLTPLVVNEFNKSFFNRAVSSTEVRIYYENGKAAFKVEATGSDAPAVQQEFEQLLNKKYSRTASGLIAKAVKNKPTSFNFQLTTLES